MAQHGLGGDFGPGDDDFGFKRRSEGSGQESSPADLESNGNHDHEILQPRTVDPGIGAVAYRLCAGFTGGSDFRRTDYRWRNPLTVGLAVLATRYRSYK